MDEVAMIDHPSIAMSGASPDGCIDKDGLIEIKCPNSATHMKTLLSKKPDGKYITQMMWQMACTGRKWCDFISFDPRFPVHLQLFITRIQRDDDQIYLMESEVGRFLDEVASMVNQLNNMKEAA